MFRVIAMTMVMTVILPGCAHIPTQSQLNDCGGDDTRPWKRITEPPGNADELRRMIKPFPDRYAGEAWFVLPTGEVMLCRISVKYTLVVEWWQFELSAEGATISDQDWVLFTGK